MPYFQATLTFWDGPHSVCGVCFSLNKSISYLSLCLSLNSFSDETLITLASLSPETRHVISVKRPWAGVSWWLRGKESTCQCKKWVWSLIWRDPTCLEASRPVSHSYWAYALDPGSPSYWAHMQQLLKPTYPLARALQQKKLPQWEACALQLERSPHFLQLEKSLHSNKDPAQPKINKYFSK